MFPAGAYPFIEIKGPEPFILTLLYSAWIQLTVQIEIVGVTLNPNLRGGGVCKIAPSSAHSILHIAKIVLEPQ